MFLINKEYHFSASHQLGGLPDDHQCARLHGHNYILTVELIAEYLDGVGFIVDYGELTFVKDVVDELDHRHLNDIFDFNPTAERMAEALWLQFAEVIRDNWTHVEHLGVYLSETPKTVAAYARHL